MEDASSTGPSPTKGGIGDEVRRREDLRLTTGKGRYSDDVNHDGQAYVAIVRSDHAHARILEVDTAAALAMPGVLAVLTGWDCQADGLKHIQDTPHAICPPDILLYNRDGSPHVVLPRALLPTDRTRHVGEAIAIVIAETAALAKDAGEKVAITFQSLASVVDPWAAAQTEAPTLYDGLKSNICIDADVGDRASTDAAFVEAAHISRLETRIQRVTGVPMEPRSVVASFEQTSGRYRVHTGCGGIVRYKGDIAAVLGVPDSSVQVIANDVGGSFGTRNNFYVEIALLAWAAKRLNRPLKWTASRLECFLSDFQGRDLDVKAELAIDSNGKFLALRATNIGNVGAYTCSFVSVTKSTELITSVYHFPTAYVHVLATLSNTPPTNPYRSAGRPEAMFVIERLIDIAAREHGFDRVELRRRNIIPKVNTRYANPMGIVYDNHAFMDLMDRALSMGDWQGFPIRKAESVRRGRHRGIAVSNYVEVVGGAPRERTDITVNSDGSVDVVIGTMSSGQGHETSFAQLITEWLGTPVERVRIFENDTDIVKIGGGSHSGRSMRIASIVMQAATNEIISKGKVIAAHLLEVAEADIDFVRGKYCVRGTDREVAIYKVAETAERGTHPFEKFGGKLSATSDQTIRRPAYPFGSAVCEVEVDIETGAVQIERYAAIDDVGRAINPLILHGQTHGGAVCGIGQALSEVCQYDKATGQLLCASLMDYALPRADAVPSFYVELSEIPSYLNPPLGIRAGGEGGTTPALAVVINAIVDALAELGVIHVEMPATAQRIWEAIRTAKVNLD